MKLEEAKKKLNYHKQVLIVADETETKNDLVEAIETVLQALDDKDKQLQETLDKSDASNVELEKQLKKYKNMYQAEHQIHLVRNEQLERKERAIQKANKYDNLIGLIKEKIENRNIQAKEHQDETILTIIGREKIILQDLLETIEGEKK